LSNRKTFFYHFFHLNHIFQQKIIKNTAKRPATPEASRTHVVDNKVIKPIKQNFLKNA